MLVVILNFFPSLVFADEPPLVILDEPELEQFDGGHYESMYVGNLIISMPEVADEEEEEIETIDVLSAPDVLAAGNKLLQNCVAVTGTFGGTTYTLYCPRATWDLLSLDANGILYNLSASNITLRVFGSDFSVGSPYRYLVLGSLNNTNSFSTLYNYGYTDYMRTYTNASNYNTSYGNFLVKEYHVYRSTDSFSMFFYVFLVVSVLWLYAFIRTHARMRMPGGR